MIEILLRKKLLAPTGKMELSLDLHLEKGDFLAIHGPSGSGKTTTLRLLAGLLEPDMGRIVLEGNTWLDTSQKINLPPQKRNIGFVFQDYALFPNMTVFRNLTFALQKEQPDDIIKELMEMMDLNGLAKRLPHQLSGGQQQRVALARALVRRPQLLLLDEPLSSLDPKMRDHLQAYILRIHEAFELTTILVSHDIQEVKRMAKQAVVLENGKIVKKGKVENVFNESNKTNQVQILAKILNIKPDQEVVKLTISIANKEQELVISADKAKGLVIGDEIYLDGVVDNIKKL